MNSAKLCFLSFFHITIFIVYYIWVPFRAIAEYQTRYKIQEETRLLKKVDNLKQNFICDLNDCKLYLEQAVFLACCGSTICKEHENNLEIINIFTEAGKINENAPKEYIGLDRFEARKRILKELKEKEFFVKEENIKNKVPYGDRSNSIIEPFLTEQWFVDAKKLSIKAKDIVNSKKTNFFPANW